MCKYCNMKNKVKHGWEGERYIVNDKISLSIFTNNFQQYPLFYTYVKDIKNEKEQERFSEFIELNECLFCGLKFDDKYFKQFE